MPSGCQNISILIGQFWSHDPCRVQQRQIRNFCKFVDTLHTQVSGIDKKSPESKNLQYLNQSNCMSYRENALMVFPKKKSPGTRGNCDMMQYYIHYKQPIYNLNHFRIQFTLLHLDKLG